MEAKTWSSKSLHWRLASTYGPLGNDRARDRDTDICQYGRDVMKGMFVVSIVTLLGCIYAGGIGDIGAWLIAGMINGFVTLGPYGQIVGMVTITVAVIGSVIGVAFKLAELRDRRRDLKRAIEQSDGYVEPEPTIYQEWYRSFKEKTCFRLQIQ